MFLSKIWLDCILYRGTAPELTFKCQPCKTFKRTQAIRWLLPTSCMSVFDHFGGVGSETINYFRQKALSKMSGNVLVTLLVSGYDYLIFVIFFFFFSVFTASRAIQWYDWSTIIAAWLWTYLFYTYWIVPCDRRSGSQVFYGSGK